jgi:hypothetical protein
MKTNKKQKYWNFKYLEMIKADNDILGTPIKKGDIVIYLGEIPNMKGHIVFEYQGHIISGTYYKWLSP